MVVGTLELQLRLHGCRSLKDKRRVLKGFLDRLRHEFCIAVAEVDDHDLWGNSVIGVACVSNSATHAESVLQHVLDAFDNNPEINVEGCQKEICRQ